MAAHSSSRAASAGTARTPPANTASPLASTAQEEEAPGTNAVTLAPILHAQDLSRTFYRSTRFGEPGSHKTVGFVIPPQPGVQGPEQLAWSGAREPARIVVSARNKATGKVEQIAFRGFRPNRCGRHPMNYAVGCQDPTDLNVLELSILEADNRGVTPGVYVGGFQIRAQGWHDKSFAKDLNFNFEVTLKKRDLDASPENAALRPTLAPARDLLRPTLFVPSRGDDLAG
jgi:hypothetical protein